MTRFKSIKKASRRSKVGSARVTTLPSRISAQPLSVPFPAMDERKPHPCAIIQSRMPAEVLSMILGCVIAAKGAGQFLDKCSNDMPVDQRMDEVRELALEDDWKVMFRFCHVCRRWREAAFSSSEFWTKLFVTSPRAQRMLIDFAMTQHIIDLWVHNSMMRPVTLYVDLRDVNWELVAVAIQAQARDQANNANVLNEIVQRIRYLVYFLTVQNCTRFKNLGIAAEGRCVAEVAMTGLQNGSQMLSQCSFPALEWLSFTVALQRPPSIELPRLHVKEAQMLRWGEPGCMPNLRTLICKNLAAQSIARAPVPKLPNQLRTLVIDLSLYNTKFFTSGVITGMLFALPHLEELTLKHHIVEAIDEQLAHQTVTDPLPTPTSKQMEAMSPLRVLRIERVEPLYLVQFWDYLRLDALQELSLDVWPGPGDTASAQDLLTRIVHDPRHPWQKLDNLRRLYVPTFEVDYGSMERSLCFYLFQQSGPSQITHLAVDYTVALDHCGGSLQDRTVLCLPKLTHLHIFDVETILQVDVGNDVSDIRPYTRELVCGKAGLFLDILKERRSMTKDPLEELILPDWLGQRLRQFSRWFEVESSAKVITFLPATKQRIDVPLTNMRYLNRSEEHLERPRHVYPCWSVGV